VVPAVAAVAEVRDEPAPAKAHLGTKPRKQRREGHGEAEPVTEAEQFDTAPSLAAPEPAAPPAPAARPQLKVSVSRSGRIRGLAEFAINNEESFALTQCTATIADGRRTEFKILRIGETTVNGRAFRFNQGAPSMPKGRMFIECAEGCVTAGIH